jgi:hypothetical protein
MERWEVPWVGVVFGEVDGSLYSIGLGLVSWFMNFDGRCSLGWIGIMSFDDGTLFSSFVF